MFDFLDNDIFVMVLNVVFLVFIIYDFRKYQQTKQKMFLVNIAITIGFAIWVMIPFYNKYITWQDKDIQTLTQNCEDNKSLCDCLTDSTIKNYDYESYVLEDKNSSHYREFFKENLQECQDKLASN